MKAVILCGGQGTRLAPYTSVLPKSLLPVDGRPVLEIILGHLRRHGIREATLAVGHLAELIMAYCGDGSRFGLTLHYSRETQPLGTAAPLARIAGLTETFLIMNGDILTDLDLGAMAAAHRSSGALCTIATHTRHIPIPFGVAESDPGGRLLRFQEKPTHTYQACAGIYLMEPRVLEFIPDGAALDMPALIQRLLDAGEVVRCHAFSGPWQDIGNREDLGRALPQGASPRTADVLPAQP